jgi:proteasome lid subunit RPN8/RPN11
VCHSVFPVGTERGHARLERDEAVSQQLRIGWSALGEIERLTAGDVREACGLMIGPKPLLGTGSFTVTELHLLHNLSNTRDQFVIAPREYEQAARCLAPSETILGVFHTHVGPVDASWADRQVMCRTHMLWLIVSRSKAGRFHELRAFDSLTGAIRPLSLRVDLTRRPVKRQRASWDPSLARVVDASGAAISIAAPSVVGKQSSGAPTQGRVVRVVTGVMI